MATFQFYCRRCGNAITADDSKLGSFVHCPSCNGQARVEHNSKPTVLPESTPRPNASPTPAPISISPANTPQLARNQTRRTWLLRLPKWLVFAVAGAVGGLVANALSEFFPTRNIESELGVFITTIPWSIAVCLGIATFIVIAQNVLLRKPAMSASQIKTLLIGSVIGGGMAGFLAQGLYLVSANNLLPTDLPPGIKPNDEQMLAILAHFFLARSVAWALMGGVIAYGMSLFIANLKPFWATLGGTLGGFFGCIGFLTIGIFFENDTASRLLGMGILGACIGVMVAAVESFCKEAWLKVIYAANESTTVNLGSKSVSIGSGTKDTIYAANTGDKFLEYRLENGLILCRKHGHETPISIGDKQIAGHITIEVCGVK